MNNIIAKLDENWGKPVIDFDEAKDAENEKQRILNVLKHRHLVEFDGSKWELTVKGRKEYDRIVEARIDKRIKARRLANHHEVLLAKLEVYQDIQKKANSPLEYMLYIYKYFVIS